MRLTGEEARRWIANNPNVAYTNNRTGQRIERQKSGIENFALGMSAPFRKGAGVAEEFGLTIKDILGYAGGGQYVDPSTRAKEGHKYAFLSEEESEQLARDPLKTGVKAGAGIASYGMGGGAKAGTTGLKAVGSAAVRNLPAGLVGGLGYSREGKELEDTLKGGAFSMAAGALFEGAKQLAPAFKAKGSAIEKKGAIRKASGQAADDMRIKTGQDYIDTLDSQIQARQDYGGLSTDSKYLQEINSQIKNGAIQGADDVLPITASTRKSLGMTPEKYTQTRKAILDGMKTKGTNITSTEAISNSYPDWLKALGDEKINILREVGDDVISLRPTSEALKKFSKIVGKGKADAGVTSRMLNDGLEEIFGKGTNIGNIPKSGTLSQVIRTKDFMNEVLGGFAKATDATSSISGQLIQKTRDASRMTITSEALKGAGAKQLDDLLNLYSNSIKFKPVINEAPIIAEQLAQKLAQSGTRQLGGLQLTGAKEVTRLGEKGLSFADKNAKALETLVQKKSKAFQSLASLKSKLSTANQFKVGLGGLSPIETSPVLAGGDVRTPLAGTQQFLGKGIQAAGTGIEKIAQLGQRTGVIPGMVGAMSSIPQRETTSTGFESLGGLPSTQQQAPSYTFMDGLQEASQIFPGASESELMSLASKLVEERGTSGGAGKVSAKDYNNATSGLQSLDKLEQILSSSGGGLLAPQLLGRGDVAEIVGGSDYQQYEALGRNVADIIGRIRTGAQMNEKEIKLYMEQFLPKWYDTQETKQVKLQQIRSYFNGIMGGDISSGGGESVSNDYGAY